MQNAHRDYTAIRAARVNTFMLGALMRLAMTAIRPFLRKPDKGAETLVWLADSEEAGAENGGYFIDCKRAQPEPPARDMESAQRLWELTEQQVSAGAR